MSLHPTMHAIKNDELMTVVEILQQLKFFASMDKILQDYFRLSTMLMAPKPLVLELLSRIRVLATKCLQEPKNIGSVANEILSSSKRGILLSSRMDMPGFCDLFQYRLEILGFMYIVTAGACLHRLTQGEHSKNEFAQRMLHYSQKALHLVKKIAVEVTDIMIWLSWYELQTRTLVDGDLGKSFDEMTAMLTLKLLLHCLDLMTLSSYPRRWVSIDHLLRMSHFL